MAADALLTELRAFLSDHPNGWSHDEWLGLLFHLSESGIDTSDEDHIGLALERERLHRTLENLDIKGLGPKRREAIASQFGTLWNLMSASEDDVAAVPGLTRSLAHQISDVLQ